MHIMKFQKARKIAHPSLSEYVTYWALRTLLFMVVSADFQTARTPITHFCLWHVISGHNLLLLMKVGGHPQFQPRSKTADIALCAHSAHTGTGRDGHYLLCRGDFQPFTNLTAFRSYVLHPSSRRRVAKQDFVGFMLWKPSRTASRE
jgi:hypothetical protein